MGYSLILILLFRGQCQLEQKIQSIVNDILVGLLCILNKKKLIFDKKDLPSLDVKQN